MGRISKLLTLYRLEFMWSFNRRKLGLVSFLICIFSVSVGHSLPFQKRDRLVFYGDSNTQHGGYLRNLEQYFQERHPDLQLQIVNEGLSGDCISSGYYERFVEEVLPRKPDVLFVIFGINDLNWGRDLSANNIKTFLDHTQATVRAALESGVRDVYVLTYPVTDVTQEGANPDLCAQIPTVTEGENSPLQKIGDEAIRLSRATCWNGRCGKGLDIQRPMRQLLNVTRAKNLRLHDCDGVHLNENGHQALAEMILGALGEKLDGLFLVDRLKPVR